MRVDRICAVAAVLALAACSGGSSGSAASGGSTSSGRASGGSTSSAGASGGSTSSGVPEQISRLLLNDAHVRQDGALWVDDNKHVVYAANCNDAKAATSQGGRYGPSAPGQVPAHAGYATVCPPKPTGN